VNPYELASRDPQTRELRVVIDTPAGSRNKYKFDEPTGLFRIARVLPQGMAFPADFGSVPGTLAEDGDPLDVLVLAQAPTFPGCLTHVRLIGELQATQREGGKRVRNSRLIAVALTPVNHPRLTSLGALEPELLNAIEHFFIAYNRAQGRDFRISARHGPREARATLARAERAYNQRDK
jgi:inorganic pyrophosphatase